MKQLNHSPCSATQTSCTRMAGFSMIEMMISITIGLFIVAGLIGLLISSSGSSKTNDRTAELQGNGRYALAHLAAKLREAGYRGYTAQAPQSSSWTTPALPISYPGVECGNAGSFVKNIRQAVWGNNDSNPFSANCIPATSYLQGDVLVTRNAATTPTVLASAIANTIYLRSAYSSAGVFQGSVLPADISATNNYALQEYVYYISPFTNSLATTGLATENPPVPALYRVALQADATNIGMTPELVVTGIEQLQVQFGISNTDGTTQFFNANGVSANVADSYATGPTNWDKISSVRIWLLARNSKPEIGYNDATVNPNGYQMGDVVYGPKNDSYRRQVFTSVIQLRNFRN